jgi:hypothetical protein
MLFVVPVSYKNYIQTMVLFPILETEKLEQFNNVLKRISVSHTYLLTKSCV